MVGNSISASLFGNVLSRELNLMRLRESRLSAELKDSGFLGLGFVFYEGLF